VSEIQFLHLDDILDIHREQIELYGGSAGVRDAGLLESACAMPTAGFGDQYLHKDIFEMAAAYLFHITQNHPFVDGNKRTATFAALLFLEINDALGDIDLNGFEEVVLGVATGKLDKAAAAGFFRQAFQG
jgi:death on curing protein